MWGEAAQRKTKRGWTEGAGEGGTVEIGWPGTCSLRWGHLSQDPEEVREPAMTFWKKTTPGGGKSKHKGLGTHGGSGEGPATAGTLLDSGDKGNPGGYE